MAASLVLAGFLAVVGPAGAVPRGPAARGVTLEVGYASRADLSAFAAGTGARTLRVIPALHVAEVAAAGPAERVVRAARRATGIRFARRTARRVSAASPALAFGLLSTPAGGAYEWQYYAAAVDQVPASVIAAARNVTIAVIDTGADLGAAALGAKVAGTYDARTGTRNVGDSNGHGTFVASLAAGSTANGAGVAGFGGDARLLVVKAASGDDFDDLAVAGGIVYAVQHGARIVNISVAGAKKSLVEAAAVQYAAQRGVLLVAAAGNDALNGNAPRYPAALLQPPGSNGAGGLGLAVGASDFADARAPFSEFGSFLSLAAPGVSVFGALPSSPALGSFQRTSLPGAVTGAYGFASGTSFAAPEVAGAAALVWAANPRLSASAVAAILEQTASGDGSWGPSLGFGVLNVARAVAAARP